MRDGERRDPGARRAVAQRALGLGGHRVWGDGTGVFLQLIANELGRLRHDDRLRALSLEPRHDMPLREDLGI